MGFHGRDYKGWLQTYLVHMRRPRRLLSEIGWRGFASFQVIILGMILSPLLHAGFLVHVLVSVSIGRPLWSQWDPWMTAYFAVMLFGYGVAIAGNIVGLRRSRQTSLIPAQLALPLYWLLIAWATVKALYELMRRPFHWFKTPHETAHAVEALEPLSLGPAPGTLR